MSKWKVIFGLVLCAVMLFCNGKVRGCSVYGKQGAFMKTLQGYAFIYYEKHGEYPVDRNGKTWFEFLKEEEPPDFFDNLYDNNISGDRSLPLDIYGFAFVYEPPSDPVNELAVIRSVGANGIDDDGKGDDWDIRYEPNLGYWYKSDWPGLYMLTKICSIVGLIGIGLIFWRVRSWWEKIYGIMIWIMLLTFIVTPLGYETRSSLAHYPPWLTTLSNFGGVLFLVNLPIIAIACVLFTRKRWILRRIRRCQELGLCLGCGYDLRGTLAAGRGECPECGEVIGDDVVGRGIEE